MIALVIGVSLLAFVAYVVIYAVFFAPVKALPDVEAAEGDDEAETFI